MANQFNKSLSKDANKGLNDGDADVEETAGQEEEEDEEPIVNEESDYYTSNEFLEHLSNKLKIFVPPGVRPTYINKAHKKNLN